MKIFVRPAPGTTRPWLAAATDSSARSAVVPTANTRRPARRVSLTTRAVAGVTWTADTAFVHHCDADHLALPLLARHLRRGSNHKPRRLEQRKKDRSAVELELLT